MSTLIATSPWSGETSFPRRPFYSWKDVGNSLVIDSAELTDVTKMGQLTSNASFLPGSIPNNFTENGVFLPNDNTFKYLEYNGAFLQSHNLHNLGFTLCFEVEVLALSQTATGTTTGGATFGGTNLCGIWGTQTLNFARQPDQTYFSDYLASLPVKTKQIYIDTGPAIVTGPTHATVHYSVEKLETGGYKASVYIDHTLWYDVTNENMADFSGLTLLLSGQAGYLGPTNTESRYKNVLLIAGPVDLTLGTGPVHCALLGDSNFNLMAYQTNGTPVPTNNPRVINSDPLYADSFNGTRFNTSGSVYLNSVLCQKGILPFWDGQYRINGKFSFFGYGIVPRQNGSNQGLAQLVDSALAASPQPEYWFSNMGINDCVRFSDGENNGYPILSDWVTYVVDTYIQQINKMLAANAANQVFIVSPSRIYTTTDPVDGSPTWQDALEYRQADVEVFNALVAEMDRRLPSVLANRGGYTDMYTEWTPLYHATSTATEFQAVHYNAEGYRVLANKIGSLVPEVINRRPSNSFLNEVYTDTVDSPYYHIPSGGSATTVPVDVSTVTEKDLPVNLMPSFVAQRVIGADAFTSVWATTVDGESITIPTQGGTFNADVDWGDGSPVENITSPTGFVHTYATAGDHTISITGTFPNIYISYGASRLKIRKVLNLGTVGWTKLNNAFYGCVNLNEFTVGSTDVSAVDNMAYMLAYCTLLTSVDLSNFNTSATLTLTNNMFQNASGLTSINIAGLDVSNVNNMSGMFQSCTSLTSLDLSGFTTTATLGTTAQMFYNCTSLETIDVSGMVTSGVANMSSMFRECTGLTSIDLSSFDTSSVQNLSYMFYLCSGLTSLNVSSFVTSSVTNMGSMFQNCNGLTSIDVSSFVTSIVTDMANMFRSCINLTSIDVTSFVTSSVTDMAGMFRACFSLTSMVGVEDWAITGLNSTSSLTNFLTSGKMTTAQYDALLVKWEAQSEFPGMSPSFGASTYTGGGIAAAARAAMLTVGRYSAINDGGIA